MVTQSVMKSLEVFERVAAIQPARVGELSAAVDLPKSTVQRHLRTLEEAGWLISSDDDYPRWTIAPRLQGLLARNIGTQDLRSIARPILERLSREFEQDVQLAVPSTRNQVVTVDRIMHSRATALSAPVGTALSRFASSAGAAMLARSSDHVIEAALIADGVPEATRAQVWSMVGDSRRNGYVERAQPSDSTVYFSAAVVDGRGEVAGAITLGLPLSGRTTEAATEVVGSADQIGRALENALTS